MNNLSGGFSFSFVSDLLSSNVDIGLFDKQAIATQCKNKSNSSNCCLSFLHPITLPDIPTLVFVAFSLVASLQSSVEVGNSFFCDYNVNESVIGLG